MNPWFLERMGEYERDRIQRDIKQIRLEKEAMRAGRMEETANQASPRRRSLFMAIASAFVRRIPLRMYTQRILQYNGSTEPCRR